MIEFFMPSNVYQHSLDKSLYPYHFLHNYPYHYPFFQLGFTPRKVEQPPQGMELQEKEAQKD